MQIISDAIAPLISNTGEISDVYKAMLQAFNQAPRTVQRDLFGAAHGRNMPGRLRHAVRVYAEEVRKGQFHSNPDRYGYTSAIRSALLSPDAPFDGEPEPPGSRGAVC